MRAFALIERGKVGIIDIEKPKIKTEYNAILRPIAMSICTSDVNTVYGTGSKKPDNLVLGHECVAVVDEVGSGVKDFKKGDIVAVPAMTPDWRNIEIQEGNFLHAGKPFSANALGRSIQGEFAEYFLIEDADATIAKLPEGVSIDDALMCVDMVTTGFSGAEEADIRFGDTVVVLGIGAVGLMAIQGAFLSGAGKIIAVGSRKVSVKLALKYGADFIFDYKADNITQKVLELTGGKGADVVIVCGGNDETFSSAIDMVRYGIGKVVNLKHFSGDGSIEIPKFSGGRGMGGKTVKMELGKGGRARMERLMSMVKYKKISPRDLITHTFYGFEKLIPALEMMRKKEDDLIKIKVVPEWFCQ